MELLSVPVPPLKIPIQGNAIGNEVPVRPAWFTRQVVHRSTDVGTQILAGFAGQIPEIISMEISVFLGSRMTEISKLAATQENT